MPATTVTQAALTFEQVEQFLVQPLMATAQVLAAASPSRIYSSQGGTSIRIPKMKTWNLLGAGVGASAQYWVGEGQQIPETDPETDELRLLDGIAAMKLLHRYSAEVARSSVVDYGATFSAALVRQLALELDAAFLVGTGDPAPGTGSPPLRTIKGITNQPDTQEVLSVGTPTVDDLLDAEGMALAAYASPSCWFMSARDFSTLRKQRTDVGGAGTGAYLIEPDVTQAGGFTLLGRPVRIANCLQAGSTSEIVLADMGQVAIGRDLAPTVVFDSSRYLDYDQQAIRVTTKWDLGLLNPAGVVVLRGVTG